MLLWENEEHEVWHEVYNRGKACLVKGMSRQKTSSWKISLSFRYARIASSPKRHSTPHLNVNKSKYCLKAEAALDRLYRSYHPTVSHLYTSPPKQCPGCTDVAWAIRLPARCLHTEAIKQRDSRQTWHCTSQARHWVNNHPNFACGKYILIAY